MEQESKIVGYVVTFSTKHDTEDVRNIVGAMLGELDARESISTVREMKEEEIIKERESFNK